MDDAHNLKIIIVKNNRDVLDGLKSLFVVVILGLYNCLYIYSFQVLDIVSCCKYKDPKLLQCHNINSHNEC